MLAASRTRRCASSSCLGARVGQRGDRPVRACGRSASDCPQPADRLLGAGRSPPARRRAGARPPPSSQPRRRLAPAAKPATTHSSASSARRRSPRVHVEVQADAQQQQRGAGGDGARCGWRRSGRRRSSSSVDRARCPARSAPSASTSGCGARRCASRPPAPAGRTRWRVVPVEPGRVPHRPRQRCRRERSCAPPVVLARAARPAGPRRRGRSARRRRRCRARAAASRQLLAHLVRLGSRAGRRWCASASRARPRSSHCWSTSLRRWSALVERSVSWRGSLPPRRNSPSRIASSTWSVSAGTGTETPRRLADRSCLRSSTSSTMPSIWLSVAVEVTTRDRRAAAGRSGRPALALLVAGRVPGQVVVDDGVEVLLEVDALADRQSVATSTRFAVLPQLPRPAPRAPPAAACPVTADDLDALAAACAAPRRRTRRWG